jgi:hypothetical protein
VLFDHQTPWRAIHDYVQQQQQQQALDVYVGYAASHAFFLFSDAACVFDCRLDMFDPARLYDIFAELLVVCSTFALALCLALTLKGLYAPSSSDSGTNGNIVYDFYWGASSLPNWSTPLYCDENSRSAQHVQCIKLWLRPSVLPNVKSLDGTCFMLVLYRGASVRIP